MLTESAVQAATFSLRAPLIATGKYEGLLAQADELEMRLKIYAEGGENALHAHLDHDHAFVVLDGQATFYDAEGNETVVDRFEGIMLPRGTHYRFQCTSPTPLVLLRSGGGARTDNGQFQRSVGRPRSGLPLPTPDEPAAYYGDAVPIPGRFVGD